MKCPICGGYIRYVPGKGWSNEFAECRECRAQYSILTEKIKENGINTGSSKVTLIDRV